MFKGIFPPFAVHCRKVTISGGQKTSPHHVIFPKNHYALMKIGSFALFHYFCAENNHASSPRQDRFVETHHHNGKETISARCLRANISRLLRANQFATCHLHRSQHLGGIRLPQHPARSAQEGESHPHSRVLRPARTHIPPRGV